MPYELKEFTVKILSDHLDYDRCTAYVDRLNRFIIFIDSVPPVTSILRIGTPSSVITHATDINSSPFYGLVIFHLCKISLITSHIFKSNYYVSMMKTSHISYKFHYNRNCTNYK